MNKKGITLIALIITIIVMIILVAIVISLALRGELFGYAGNAAKETIEEKEKEERWARLESNMSTDELIAKYIGGDLDKLKEYFVDNGMEDTVEQDEESPYGFHFKNNEIIPDAETSIIFFTSMETSAYLHNVFITYNNNFYAVALDENIGKFTDVYAINGEKDVFSLRLLNAINITGEAEIEGNYIKYNNKKYTDIYSEETFLGFEFIELNNDMAIVKGWDHRLYNN